MAIEQMGLVQKKSKDIELGKRKEPEQLSTPISILTETEVDLEEDLILQKLESFVERKSTKSVITEQSEKPVLVQAKGSPRIPLLKMIDE